MGVVSHLSKMRATIVLLLAGLASASASTCASMPTYMSGDRIVGGADAPSAIPWQVSLRYCESGGCHFCGGTILDSKTILSAAHCTGNIGSDLSGKYIMAGSNKRSTGGQVLQVEKGVWNDAMPFNDNTLDNDVVILKLKDALSMGETNGVLPACLPPSDHLEGNGQVCYVSGWGTLQSGANSLPEDLQYVDVPLISNAKCNDQYNGAITSNMICAGYDEGGKDSCQGDSGGPLVCTNTAGQALITGVVSWGAGCAWAGKAGVYARVTPYLDWIKANMEGGTPSPPSPSPPSPSPPSPTPPSPEPPTTGCPDKIDDWHGDNYCDDFMNTEGCQYDGGDCCQSSPTPGWDNYCEVCECLDGSPAPCEDTWPEKKCQRIKNKNKCHKKRPKMFCKKTCEHC